MFNINNDGMIYYSNGRNIFKAKGRRGKGHQKWVWNGCYWTKAYANKLPANALKIDTKDARGYMFRRFKVNA